MAKQRKIDVVYENLKDIDLNAENFDTRSLKTFGDSFCNTIWGIEKALRGSLTQRFNFPDFKKNINRATEKSQILRISIHALTGETDYIEPKSFELLKKSFKDFQQALHYITHNNITYGAPLKLIKKIDNIKKQNAECFKTFVNLCTKHNLNLLIPNLKKFIAEKSPSFSFSLSPHVHLYFTKKRKYETFCYELSNISAETLKETISYFEYLNKFDGDLVEMKKSLEDIIDHFNVTFDEYRVKKRKDVHEETMEDVKRDKKNIENAGSGAKIAQSIREGKLSFLNFNELNTMDLQDFCEGLYLILLKFIEFMNNTPGIAYPIYIPGELNRNIKKIVTHTQTHTYITSEELKTLTESCRSLYKSLREPEPMWNFPIREDECDQFQDYLYIFISLCTKHNCNVLISELAERLEMPSASKAVDLDCKVTTYFPVSTSKNKKFKTICYTLPQNVTANDVKKLIGYLEKYTDPLNDITDLEETIEKLKKALGKFSTGDELYDNLKNIDFNPDNLSGDGLKGFLQRLSLELKSIAYVFLTFGAKSSGRNKYAKPVAEAATALQIAINNVKPPTDIYVKEDKFTKVLKTMKSLYFAMAEFAGSHFSFQATNKARKKINELKDQLSNYYSGFIATCTHLNLTTLINNLKYLLRGEKSEVKILGNPTFYFPIKHLCKGRTTDYVTLNGNDMEKDLQRLINELKKRKKTESLEEIRKTLEDILDELKKRKKTESLEETRKTPEDISDELKQPG